MFKKIFPFLLFSLVLLAFAAAHQRVAAEGNNNAANLSVSFVGPYGGDVRALIIDPADAQRLYLGTNDGQIYRSLDGAKNWSRLLSFDHPGYSVDKLIVDERSPKTIYAPIWWLANDT